MGILSTNNGRITVKFDGLGAIEIDNFDPESDMWTVNDRQTADAEITPDGIVNYWAINALIECTLTLSGASRAATQLRSIADAQMRRGTTDSDLKKVSVVVEVGGKRTVYSEGVMTSGKAGDHLGNQKLQNQPFNFKFGDVK